MPADISANKWYTYTALIWGLKACMLFFLNRLTFGLNSQTVVKALAVVCAVTYLVVFLTITVSCHPIQLNWQTVPYPPIQCTLRAQNMYVSTILNVITDGAILSVPMPLLWKLKVPLRKKLTLAALLSSGVFVITAALVRIVMSLKAHPSALTINRWGVRETIAGIIAVNIPIIRPREFAPLLRIMSEVNMMQSSAKRSGPVISHHLPAYRSVTNLQGSQVDRWHLLSANQMLSK